MRMSSRSFGSLLQEGPIVQMIFARRAVAEGPLVDANGINSSPLTASPRVLP